MKTIDIITEDVLKEFGDRKTEGRIDFVFDISTSKAYVVPKDLEHKDFVPTLPNYAPKTIRFVPSQLRLQNGKVKEIITGASSYEANEKISHPLKDLYQAHELMWIIILNSSLQVDLERDEVLKNYAI